MSNQDGKTLLCTHGPGPGTRLLYGKLPLREPKTLGLNWNRQNLYILNGIDMGSRCSYYMNSQRFNFRIIKRKKEKQNWITEITMPLINESQHEKTCLRGYRPRKPQTNLLSYRN